MLTRREMFFGLVGVLAIPAIVRQRSLMRLSPHGLKPFDYSSIPHDFEITVQHVNGANFVVAGVSNVSRMGWPGRPVWDQPNAVIKIKNIERGLCPGDWSYDSTLPAIVPHWPASYTFHAGQFEMYARRIQAAMKEQILQLETPAVNLTVTNPLDTYIPVKDRKC